jgi:hypothetical protein
VSDTPNHPAPQRGPLVDFSIDWRAGEVAVKERGVLLTRAVVIPFGMLKAVMSMILQHEAQLDGIGGVVHAPTPEPPKGDT